MPIAKWAVNVARNQASIDSIDPTGNYGGFYNLGLYYIPGGGGKGALRRCFQGYDVLGDAPASGGPVDLSVVPPVNAWLEADCLSLFGAGGHAGHIVRLLRLDWAYATCTWQLRATGLPWQVGGAEGALDIDAVNPLTVGFTTPTATGVFTWPGLLGFVQDAIALRGGLVLMRHRLDSEADNGIDRMMAAQSWRLCVEYVDPDLAVPTQPAPAGPGPHRRPVYDPIADMRPNGAGRLIRQIDRTRASLRRSVRG